MSLNAILFRTCRLPSMPEQALQTTPLRGVIMFIAALNGIMNK
jgi:hypothetical protein